MQQRRELDQVYTNRKLLNGQLDTPKWWLPTVSILGVVVLIGVIVIATELVTPVAGFLSTKNQG